ncbi:HNH endonuclease [Rhodovulum sulfidophilum]|uniref:HNH endonuclease n=1 Tax=Rhodovulum sulfidophilum TaxID=35806 RepID=A0ABS1RZA9_RHOSU|nr:hypothetical protein [Rhodovulum sulfidophilum]MBL3611018.1 hypothetical protein [Rhodovulum sulfidophilum]MCE8457897.1 hypothetical protein [Rhodovulum sulfidophilum]
MKKLAGPNITFSDALREVYSGISCDIERARYANAIPDADEIEEQYCIGANNANLFEFPRVTSTRDDPDPAVRNGLRKSDLTKLYTQFFVPQKKPGRLIYDRIKVSAKGKCPFCGGVGQVRTLDHYLPKANFPLVSVLPANLIPSCGDCNFDKSNHFPYQRNKQTLNPYYDSDHFFVQQWIFARVVPSSPVVLDFFVDPPAGWSEEDRERVVAHFQDYDLAERFAIEAAADLPETITTRRTTLSALTPGEFSEHLTEKARNQALPVNNWRRVMFLALSQDEWFCSREF